MFDAYNRCDMEAFSSYFIPKVEFYHDHGGVTWDRDAVVANTRKYICGKVRRELLPTSLKVYPIKDYGAIEEGEHRFCQVDSGKCEGIAKFLMIWELQDGKWQMTRVVSYGHRSLAPGESVPAR
ncbi:MAG: nuclear transport factor 2 family protein [Collimonas sp.]|uniref:nuclear transport factor 2 family protein n=1 Tax=Collimonas sp. TaxID=1963772 RepID=UPI0032638649